MPSISQFGLSLLMAMGIIGNVFVAPAPKAQEAPIAQRETPSGFLMIQKNSLFALSPTQTPKVSKRVDVIITGYSSSPQETDNDPFITASATKTREGVVANNYLPFGTKIRFPEIYGDKIFVIEDRMNWKKDNYHFDIWFPSRTDALNFGAKRTYVEILEN